MDINKLGSKIKNYRIEKGFTIKELAEKIDLSSSLLSQIERGLANPSLNTLSLIADTLEVPIFSLFIEEYKEGLFVVKKKDRIKIHNANTKKNIGYELLIPDMKGSIQMCEMTLGPRKKSVEGLTYHNGEEVIVCTKGTIELHLDDLVFVLEEGDSIRIDRCTPHYWENTTEENATIIFAITPTIF